MVAAAVIGSAVVGTVASSVASGNAADAQTAAANQANQTAQQQYNQTRADLLPYNTAGQSALTTLQNNNYYTNPFTMTQSQLEQTPGYQFNLSQGLKSTQNAAAARGLGVSGAALKGAANYATGLADSTYQNQFNNYQTQTTNQYNRLMGGAQLGENAAAQTGNYGTQTAANIGNNLVGAGNAQAASSIATGNAISGAGNSVGNLYLTNALLQQNGGAGLFGSAATAPSVANGGLSYGGGLS